jgi:hypothetical protein
VAIRKLQQIHATTHPGAKLEREPSIITNEDNGRGNDVEQKTALLDALDAEGDEEQEE